MCGSAILGCVQVSHEHDLKTLVPDMHLSNQIHLLACLSFAFQGCVSVIARFVIAGVALFLTALNVQRASRELC